MKILATSLAIMAMLLIGCAEHSGNTPMPPVPDNTSNNTILPSETPVPDNTSDSDITLPDKSPVPSDTPDSSVVLPAEEPPEDRTWVSPGKVNIGNFHPGARAEFPVTIHNGKDTKATFNVAYRYPDHVATGYVKPPEQVQDWVIIADMTPVLMPKETKDVLVVLEMPEEAKVEDKKWEFWVSVIDMSQKGTVKTELCVRTLVDMR